MENTIATDYESISAALNAMDKPRAGIYTAIEKVRNQLAATSNWKGEDADKFKLCIETILTEAYNCAKWMNANCVCLKGMALDMKKNADESANIIEQANQ